MSDTHNSKLKFYQQQLIVSISAQNAIQENSVRCGFRVWSDTLGQVVDVFSDENNILMLLVREVEVDRSRSKDESVADVVGLVEAEPGAPWWLEKQGQKRL